MLPPSLLQHEPLHLARGEETSEEAPAVSIPSEAPRGATPTAARWCRLRFAWPNNSGRPSTSTSVTLFLPSDPALDAAVAASHAAGLPTIAVSPTQGKLPLPLALARQAKSILEIGTLGGYSTIWLARALPPEGRLVTLEIDATHAEVARSEHRTSRTRCLRSDVRLGPADRDAAPSGLRRCRPLRPRLHRRRQARLSATTGRGALRLSRRGTLIIADNVVRDGAVADAGSADANVQGVRRYLDCVAAEPGVTGTVIQTVGREGVRRAVVRRRDCGHRER
jgi:predicted O-methyltransferase YrrM